MNGLAFADDDPEWKVVRSDTRGECEYRVAAGVTHVDFTQHAETLPEGFGYLGDLLDELESDPEIAAAAAAARAEVAAERSRAQGTDLTTLRLAKGLSQHQLAAAVGSVQPAISRIESGEQEPKLSMIRRLAVALDVDFNVLIAALPHD